MAYSVLHRMGKLENSSMRSVASGIILSMDLWVIWRWVIYIDFWEKLSCNLMFMMIAQVQEARVQDAKFGWEAAEGSAHAGEPEAISRMCRRWTCGEDLQDVCQGSGPQFPLPRNGRDAPHDGHGRQEAQ